MREQTTRLILNPMIAKLRRKCRQRSENQEARIRQLTGELVEAFIKRLQTLPVEEASRWLGRLEGLANGSMRSGEATPPQRS